MVEDILNNNIEKHFAADEIRKMEAEILKQSFATPVCDEDCQPLGACAHGPGSPTNPARSKPTAIVQPKDNSSPNFDEIILASDQQHFSI